VRDAVARALSAPGRRRCVLLGCRTQPRRYRTAELFLKHPANPGVVYSDNRLYRELLQEYPEVGGVSDRVRDEHRVASLARRPSTLGCTRQHAPPSLSQLLLPVCHHAVAVVRTAHAQNR
jgi:hypothetical protein